MLVKNITQPACLIRYPLPKVLFASREPVQFNSEFKTYSSAETKLTARLILVAVDWAG